jgi:transcriptional regulator with XRE-family HTH domain
VHSIQVGEATGRREDPRRPVALLHPEPLCGQPWFPGSFRCTAQLSALGDVCLHRLRDRPDKQYPNRESRYGVVASGWVDDDNLPVNVASPTVRRRRLAAALRRLRDQSGQTIDAVAKEAGISRSALSRMENAQVSISVPSAAALLRVYGVDGDDLEALLQVAREARKRGWWQSYSEVLPDWFETYVGLEAEASEIRTFQPQLVPGLLQTADYARAVIVAEHPEASAEEVKKRVELRMKRQDAENKPKLWVILDQAVLMRPVGGANVMEGQLKRLQDEATKPGVTIQVLAFDAGEHGSMGSSFSILSFPEPGDAPVVYIETRAGSLYLEGAQAREYSTLFTHLTASGRDQRTSAVLLANAAGG